MAKELWQMTAAQASALMAKGELGSEEYTAAFLARIQEREPVVQAWAHVNAALALEQARRCDRESRRGPLHGIPIGFKDVIRSKDQPTQHGSPLYAGFQPGEDAHCVAALRAAGAVILGKTQTLEFACGGQFPPTRNPRDLQRTPGGSSSGSGAAVADGMAPLTLGTQTGGSLIRPAAFCGVYAMKPTFGRVCFDGVKPYAPHLDTLGWYGRSIQDLVLLADLFRLTDLPGVGAQEATQRDSRAQVGDSHVGLLRIGICETPMWDQAEPSAQRALHEAAAQLARSGAKLEPLVLGEAYTAINQQQDEVMQDGGRGAFLAEYLSKPEGLHADFKAKIENHLSLTPQRMRDALDALALRRIEFERQCEGLDAVLTLSAPGVAPVGLHTQGMATFNRIWTALHVPAINLPGAHDAHGLPIGLQLVGRRYDDGALLRVAALLESVLDV